MGETSASLNRGLDAAARDRARLSFDLDVDICVVGAGLAGLTVALEAARLGASVAVLEGRHVGWNASGNQLGTVMPGYGLPIGELIERIGFDYDFRNLIDLMRYLIPLSVQWPWRRRRRVARAPRGSPPGGARHRR